MDAVPQTIHAIVERNSFELQRSQADLFLNTTENNHKCKNGHEASSVN